jgi:CubicO group peptidase (beta-lactamase class C family)
MKPTRIRGIAVAATILVAACTTATPSSSGGTSPATASASSAACASADSVECLDALLATMAADGAFSAVVAVSRDGETLLEAPYGTNASGGPMEVDDSFVIASIGKMFTAVAIAQLVEDGQVAFEDPAGSHVDDLPPDVGAASVAQLLSHTSGLGESIANGIEFEAGTFNYTNAGFDVLARVVEQASGQPFATYLGEHVFQPAGMTATRLAVDTPPGEPQGWGGEESTAADLLRFADALIGDRLLSPEMTQVMTSEKVATDPTGGYGYGFATFGDDAVSFGHYGAFEDFLGFVNIGMDSGYTIVALCDQGCDATGPPLFEFLDSIGMAY